MSQHVLHPSRELVGAQPTCMKHKSSTETARYQYNHRHVQTEHRHNTNTARTQTHFSIKNQKMYSGSPLATTATNTPQVQHKRSYAIAQTISQTQHRPCGSAAQTQHKHSSPVSYSALRLSITAVCDTIILDPSSSHMTQSTEMLATRRVT